MVVEAVFGVLYAVDGGFRITWNHNVRLSWSYGAFYSITTFIGGIRVVK